MGTQLTLPQGYTGQIWKSNAPAPTLSAASVPRPVAKRDREPETPVYTHESPRRSQRKQINTDTAHPTPSTTTASHRPPAKKIKLADKLAAAKAKKAAQAKPATGSAAAHHTIVDEVKENKPVKFSMDASPSPEPEDVLKLERDVREEQYEMHRTTADASQDMHMQNADAVKPESALGDATVVQEAAQPVPKPPSAASLTLDLLDTPPRPSTPPTITSRLLPAPAFHIDADEPPLTFPQLTLQRDMIPIASWTTMTVWNPDTLPDLGDDPYVKSISEWTQLARLVSRSFSHENHELT